MLISAKIGKQIGDIRTRKRGYLNLSILSKVRRAKAIYTLFMSIPLSKIKDQ
jgi:hypothetical protein